MKKMIIGIIIGGIIFGTIGVVASTMISSKNVAYQNKTVNSALDELYNDAISGKELIAAAITNKGITTTVSDSYETMATNINNIDTDNSELNQKISNLESKHNSDITSLTGSISNLTQNLTGLSKLDTVDKLAETSSTTEIIINLNQNISDYKFIIIANSNSGRILAPTMIPTYLFKTFIKIVNGADEARQIITYLSETKIKLACYNTAYPVVVYAVK